MRNRLTTKKQEMEEGKQDNIRAEMDKEKEIKEHLKKRGTKIVLHIKSDQKFKQLQGKTEAKGMRAKITSKKQKSEESEQMQGKIEAEAEPEVFEQHGPDQSPRWPQGSRMLNSPRKSQHTLWERRTAGQVDQTKPNQTKAWPPNKPGSRRIVRQ